MALVHGSLGSGTLFARDWILGGQERLMSDVPGDLKDALFRSKTTNSSVKSGKHDSLYEVVD
ncbi:hypothetical protein SCA6_012527 [Theobroma cacao]